MTASVGTVDTVHLIPTSDGTRQDFEDAVWGIHTPGATNFTRNADGSYIDGHMTVSGNCGK